MQTRTSGDASKSCMALMLFIALSRSKYEDGVIDVTLKNGDDLASAEFGLTNGCCDVNKEHGHGDGNQSSSCFDGMGSGRVARDDGLNMPEK